MDDAVTGLATYFLALMLLSEYGVRTRGKAIAHLAGKRRLTGGVIRAAAWLIPWFLIPVPCWGVSRVVLYLATLLYGEAAVWLFRWKLGADMDAGQRHGKAETHLILPGAALTLYWAIAAWSHYGGLPPLAGFAVWPTRPVAVIAAITALGPWATLLTVSLVDTVRTDAIPQEATSRLGAGELIGLVERIVVFALVLSGGLTAVGFVVAAKSAARFPEFQKKEFAEYFLIGTLTSVGVATLAALAVLAA